MTDIPFFVFAWIASIGYAVQTIISKLTTKHSITSPWLFNFLWNFFALILLVPIALYNGAGIPSHWGNIIPAAITYALVGIFFILSLYKLDVSVLTPLFSVRAAFAVLLGVVFLHESISGFQYFLIALILIFGVLVSVDERFSLKSFFNKGVLFAMLLMIVLPLQATFIKRAVGETDFWTTTLWMMFLSQVLLMLTIPMFKKELRKINVKQYGATIATAVAGLAATLAANKAFSENISITSAILSVPLSMIFVALFSIFKPELLEKHTFKIYAVRFISAAVMIVAALKLG